MSGKQENERQKANELLQQLQAVYLNGGNDPDEEPAEPREEPEKAARKQPEPSAPENRSKPDGEAPAAAKPTTRPTKTEKKPAPQPQKKPVASAAPAAILALTEEAVAAESAPEKPKEGTPAPAKQPEAQKTPEEPKPAPAKKEAVKAAKNDSQGTTLPRSAPSPFLRKPEPPAEEPKPAAQAAASPAKEPEPEAAEAPAAKPETEQKPKTRPNTVKVPPRKRSGINTGAIRPKNAPPQGEPVVAPPRAEAETPKPAASADRYGGTAIPRRPAVIVIPPREPAAQPAPEKKPEPPQAKPTVAPAPKAESVAPKATAEPAPKAAETPAAPAPRPEPAAKTEPVKTEPIPAKMPEKPAEKSAEKPAAKESPAPERKPEPRPVSRVVDFDGRPTVEPIENVEAAETVSEPPKKKQAALLRRTKRQKKAEEGLDATAIIAKRTGLDESDIALIFELGYENELGRLVGYETLKKLKYEHLRSSRADTSDYYSQAFGYRGKEYTSATPREQVLAAYVHDRRNLILRIALTALLCVVLFIADFPTLLGGVFPTYAAKLPFLFPSVGFVLFCAVVLLTRRRIVAGWRAFLRFAPSPYSAVSVAVPLMLLYGVAAIIDARAGTLLPMNFAAGLSLLALTVCDAVRIADEIRTFRVVSEVGDKTVLEESEPRKKKLRQGNRTVKILNDEAGERLYRVRPTHEIVGFFRRVNDLSAASAPFTRFTVFLLACAAASGIAASLILDNPIKGVLVAAATLMFSVPVSATWLFFDPLRRANRRLISRRSALVGEGSVNEYSGKKTVIFNDTETFKAKRQTQIAVRDGDDFRRDLRLAGILFRKLGGTLATVGTAVAEKDEPDPTVNLIRLTETGVEALVENRYRLLAGDSSFLTHSGVDVPKESTDRSAIRSRGVSILYVAVNGTLKLTYEISYTMSHSFRDVIALLAQTETTLAVQSYDPNLNDAFLHVGFADGDEVVRVIKPAQFELPTPAEITDTGAVTLDGPLGTSYPLRAASLIVQARRLGFRALLASILPGAVLAFFAVRNLPAKLLPFLPLFAVGYRAIWFVVSWITSAVSLSRRAVFDDTRENLANEDREA